MEIYKLSDELDSFNYQEVQDGIIAILEKGNDAVLDMTECNYVSSTGLRVLLYCKKMAASQGLRFCLVGVNDVVKDIMSVTGFNSFFETFNTLEEVNG